MYYVTADWPGGLYYSPTFAGSRPGALSAACWAAMVSIGQDGYLEATRRILETADVIKDGIAGIDGVEVIGDPLFDIAVRPTEEGLDIYQVLERMGKRHWSLNGLQDPASFHLCVTLRHTQPGVAERFLEDLAAAVEEVRTNPDPNQGLVPVYGMAAVPEMRGAVTDILGAYIDLLYEP
jgi:glutamate/tyrosine decarboxylase-like PLP-dependent enzyme